MDGKTGTRHERWVQRTEAAYRRMYEGKSQEELATLTQREDMAVLIGRELAAFLCCHQEKIQATGNRTTAVSLLRTAHVEASAKCQGRSSSSAKSASKVNNPAARSR